MSERSGNVRPIGPDVAIFGGRGARRPHDRQSPGASGVQVVVLERREEERGLQILEALGARFVSINATAAGGRTLSPQTSEAAFLDWARQNRFTAALVRPDRFIVDRIEKGKDLPTLRLFAPVLQVRGVARDAA